jgi:polysaccharide biosynthesis protein PslG
MLKVENLFFAKRWIMVFLFSLLLAVAFGPACKSGGGDDDDDNTTPAGVTDTNPYVSMIASGPTLASTLGISSHISKGVDYSRTREFELEKLSAAGVNTLRTDFAWSRIEGEQGQYTPEGYDAMVDLTVAAGIDLLAIVDYGVDWAMPGGSHDEIDPEVFGDYAGYLATHFGDRIKYYEIWNEQNTARFWSPEPNPEHYGKLLKASAQAIREADSDAFIIFGGLCSLDEYINGPDGFWSFVVQTHEYHPDLCDYIDALAIHPYTFLQGGKPEEELFFDSWNWPSYTDMILHARDLLERIGCRDKPIWLTETGWPSITIGAENQAAYLVRSLLLTLSVGAEKYMWYTFWNGSGNAVPVTEDYFGLFSYPREDEQDKPAYRALLAVYEIAGDMKYAGDLGQALGWSSEDNLALVFTDEQSERLIAVWKNTDDETDSIQVTVPLPENSMTWTVYDQYGEVLEQGEGGTEVQITSSMSVTYISVTVQ